MGGETEEIKRIKVKSKQHFIKVDGFKVREGVGLIKDGFGSVCKTEFHFLDRWYTVKKETETCYVTTDYITFPKWMIDTYEVEVPDSDLEFDEDNKFIVPDDIFIDDIYVFVDENDGELAFTIKGTPLYCHLKTMENFKARKLKWRENGKK